VFYVRETAMTIPKEVITVSVCDCEGVYCRHDVEEGLITEQFLEGHRQREAKLEEDEMKTTTIDMAYDGPADNNPFVPRVGDVVARCAHEPRPLHIHMVAERPVVDGVAVEWMNLCRPCKEREVSGTLMLRTWSEEDAERVRGAGRP
jgi:hypothetical protein